MRSTLPLLIGACLVSGVAAVRLRAEEPTTSKANVTSLVVKANATRTARAIKAVFKILKYKIGGCKKSNSTKINPGTPLPEGKFNWDIEDFSPEALKMSPCGQDGESGIFDGPADESGEGGLAQSADFVDKILKGYCGKLFVRDAAGKLDHAGMFATLNPAVAGATADDFVTLGEFEAWMDQQPIAGGQDSTIRADIFDMFDFNMDGQIDLTEFTTMSDGLEGLYFTAPVQTALISQKKANATRSARAIKAVFEILKYKIGGCKKSNATKINPGTPLPEGKFNWDIEDFNPEALKMSPCGQDGESGIFDSAADESGEGGLAQSADFVDQILKGYCGKLFVRNAAGELDHAGMFATLNPVVAGATADDFVTLGEFEAWMEQQPMAGADSTIKGDIFDMFDLDKDGQIDLTEFTTMSDGLEGLYFTVPAQTALISQKKANATKANATRAARAIKAVFKILKYKIGGCKKSNSTKINPGTPLPEGKFNWDIEDFSPEALKMSPCGQDGESGIFDGPADESGEGGLAQSADFVDKILKGYCGKLFVRDAAGKLDHAGMFATLNPAAAGATADDFVTLGEFEAWMDQQPVAGGQDSTIRADIFDMFDFNMDGQIDLTEFTTMSDGLEALYFTAPAQTALTQEAIFLSKR